MHTRLGRSDETDRTDRLGQGTDLCTAECHTESHSLVVRQMNHLRSLRLLQRNGGFGRMAAVVLTSAG